jgi:hypothetical protein
MLTCMSVRLIHHSNHKIDGFYRYCINDTDHIRHPSSYVRAILSISPRELVYHTVASTESCQQSMCRYSPAHSMPGRDDIRTNRVYLSGFGQVSLFFRSQICSDSLAFQHFSHMTHQPEICQMAHMSRKRPR